jgi:LacI family transcriptional regulator
MKATINDVAKHASVSIKTVSRVINNETSVRASTREKVLLSVQALHYQPNASARNLAGTKSYNIAYVYDNSNAYYIIDMQEGIISACQKQGFGLVIHPCDTKKADTANNIFDMIEQSNIAGVVLTPPFSEYPEFVKKVTSLGVKVVRIMSGDHNPDDISPCIMINDHAAAFNITQHLVQQGHIKIAFISGGAEHHSTIERLDGYKHALLTHNIPFDEAFVIDGEYTFESGVEGARQLMGVTNKPTAIFACNDEIAAGALFAARLMNFSIPEDLSIAGFENSPFSRQTWPQLTTANQPNKEIAENAANLLIAQTRKESIKDMRVQYTPELLVRDSTAHT